MESLGIENVKKYQKKFFQSVRIRKVAGSIPVESTMTEQAVYRLLCFLHHGSLRRSGFVTVLWFTARPLSCKIQSL